MRTYGDQNHPAEEVFCNPLRSSLQYLRATHYRRTSFSERSKYIPVRLTADERSYLRLVESVISVTDYTGKVDADFPSASKRQNVMLKQVSYQP